MMVQVTLAWSAGPDHGVMQIKYIDFPVTTHMKYESSRLPRIGAVTDYYIGEDRKKSRVVY